MCRDGITKPWEGEALTCICCNHRVIRALKVQGHSVFGLTSNAIDNVHTPKILETLAKYKIR